MIARSKREKLIETALELFSRNGYHATGIDQILKVSGIAKKTLYTYFRTKEELILAVLRYYDGLFRNDFIRKVETIADTPIDRLYAIFDVAYEWFSSKQFYGCLFINAISEFSEANTEIRQVCKSFKRLMRNYILDLCKKSNLHKPNKVADQIALLLEGTIVTAQVSQNPNAAMIAKEAIRSIITSNKK